MWLISKTARRTGRWLRASCQTASFARSPGCSMELFQSSAEFVDVLGRQSRDKHVCRHRHWIEEIFNESPS